MANESPWKILFNGHIGFLFEIFAYLWNIENKTGAFSMSMSVYRYIDYNPPLPPPITHLTPSPPSRGPLCTTTITIDHKNNKNNNKQHQKWWYTKFFFVLLLLETGKQNKTKQNKIFPTIYFVFKLVTSRGYLGIINHLPNPSIIFSELSQLRGAVLNNNIKRHHNPRFWKEIPKTTHDDPPINHSILAGFL